MESRQNTDIDNFFIDRIRFSARAPYLAVTRRRPVSRVLNSGREELVIPTEKILWHIVDNGHVQNDSFLWGSNVLSRYENTRRSRVLDYVSPTWQNNIRHYSQDSAVGCVADVLESYRSLSSWMVLEYYLESVKLIYIEFGIDFINLHLPSLAQLIDYASGRRGSASRSLKLYTSSGVTYEYNKEARAWNNRIDDKTYLRLIGKGEATLYIGSRNIEFKIYKKHRRIRVELAVRGRAQVSRFLNPASSDNPSRHITKLADRETIRFLTDCYITRLSELFGGNVPDSAHEAAERALATFRISAIPDEWTIREIPKQEFPPLSYDTPTKTAEEAIYIDTVLQKSFILPWINNAVLLLFPVNSVSLAINVFRKIRAPPYQLTIGSSITILTCS